MHFAAANLCVQSMNDPSQADTRRPSRAADHAGQPLAFTITGTGTISDQPAQTPRSAAKGGIPSGRDNRRTRNDREQSSRRRPRRSHRRARSAPKIPLADHRSLRRPAGHWRLDRHQTPDREPRVAATARSAACAVTSGNSAAVPCTRARPATSAASPPPQNPP